MGLTDLPNIGPKLAENLRRAGVDGPEAFQAVGAEYAFLLIRSRVDPAACFHQLTALAGAELGIAKKALTAEKKAVLREFFDHLPQEVRDV